LLVKIIENENNINNLGNIRKKQKATINDLPQSYHSTRSQKRKATINLSRPKNKKQQSMTS